MFCKPSITTKTKIRCVTLWSSFDSYDFTQFYKTSSKVEGSRFQIPHPWSGISSIKEYPAGLPGRGRICPILDPSPRYCRSKNYKTNSWSCGPAVPEQFQYAENVGIVSYNILFADSDCAALFDLIFSSLESSISQFIACYVVFPAFVITNADCYKYKIAQVNLFLGFV